MFPYRVSKGSAHTSPSPNGKLIASLSLPTLTIRSLSDLGTTNVRKLPSELSGPVSSLLWSPSSSRVLVSTMDQIHVFSVAESSSYHAVVRNPLPPSPGKAPIVLFGADDSVVLVCSPLGLKLVICDLRTSTAVEITNPKFHSALSFGRGCSLRPGTAHVALLTRSSGKDMVSLHHPQTRQLQRSWAPETQDAQAIMWTPDGRWLLLWESPAHGRRILLYTPDGQLFRALEASNISPGQDTDLEAGIKLCHVSPDSNLCAVCDYTRIVTLLDTDSWRPKMHLAHPSTIVPKDTLQVWQEQLDASSKSATTQPFLRAKQMFAPPGAPADSKPQPDLVREGCSLAAFDASSTLLATRLDESPSTVWIWDANVGELRAVITFHSTVTFQWHTSLRETLLIKCLDEGRRGIFYVWDPLSNGPSTIAVQAYVPGRKVIGKPSAVWIYGETEPASLLLSDARHCALLSLSSADQQGGAGATWSEADQSQPTVGETTADELDVDLSLGISDKTDTSVADDTFSFRHA